ncbi:MAG TPA: T9SS type A sorting domain-containing protein [Bacteroidia bacterium]|nr:T9SS type A sorting domain-containing protein [Bacteroidia bacterium]
MKNFKQTCCNLKAFLMMVCFFFIYYCSFSQYISSTVEQVSSPTVTPASVNNPVIRIRIDVGQNPITVYNLFMSTNGSTNPIADIDSAKIFYTDTSSVFSANVQYGPTVSHPGSGISIGNGNMFPIDSGANYFWLVYDINDSAIVCDSIDATCYSIYMSNGTATPAVTDPPGFAIIGSCPTGINDENIQHEYSWFIYPNPSRDFILVQNKSSSKNLWIKLVDITGKSVFEKTISAENNFQIQVNNLESGMYLIIVSDDKKTFRQKIIVRH